MPKQNNELYMCLCDKCKQAIINTNICPKLDRCCDYSEYLKYNDLIPSGKPVELPDCSECWENDKSADATLYTLIDIYNLCEPCKAIVLQWGEQNKTD